MAVALYFLDKLALRAGHEKDDDEADTVGCCTLKVENLELVPPSSLKFDFLGKDSIRYENTVAVEPPVYANVEQFLRVDKHGKKKGGRDLLFDAFDATDLNRELKTLMDGLSVKVFRTYNASVTLDRLLAERAAELARAAGGREQGGRRAVQPPAQRAEDARRADGQDGGQDEGARRRARGARGRRQGALCACVCVRVCWPCGWGAGRRARQQTHTRARRLGF